MPMLYIRRNRVPRDDVCSRRVLQQEPELNSGPLNPSPCSVHCWGLGRGWEEEAGMASFPSGLTGVGGVSCKAEARLIGTDSLEVT